MTNFQSIMLRRLSAEFDVDVTPAQGLVGAALDAWIERAEDELFERLIAIKYPASRTPVYVRQRRQPGRRNRQGCLTTTKEGLSPWLTRL